VDWPASASPGLCCSALPIVWIPTAVWTLPVAWILTAIWTLPVVWILTAVSFLGPYTFLRSRRPISTWGRSAFAPFLLSRRCHFDAASFGALTSLPRKSAPVCHSLVSGRIAGWLLNNRFKYSSHPNALCLYKDINVYKHLQIFRQ